MSYDRTQSPIFTEINLMHFENALNIVYKVLIQKKHKRYQSTFKYSKLDDLIKPTQHLTTTVDCGKTWSVKSFLKRGGTKYFKMS